MSRVRVSGFSISLDGYGAGPAQSEQHPLGVRGVLTSTLENLARFVEETNR